MLPDAPWAAYGSAILAFLVVVPAHVIGLHVVAGMERRRPRGHLHFAVLRVEIPFVVRLVAALFAVHVATNLLWGVFVFAVGAVHHFRDAVFFAFENYTSLGLTTVEVDERWRTLAPLISLSGVFCLAWSTALLAALFNHVYSPK